MRALVQAVQSHKYEPIVNKFKNQRGEQGAKL